MIASLQYRQLEVWKFCDPEIPPKQPATVDWIAAYKLSCEQD